MKEIETKILNVLDTYFLPKPTSSVGVEELLRLVKEIYQAFGGCEICYGKGFSTEVMGGYVAGDFYGEENAKLVPKIIVHPCSCERGKMYQESIKHMEPESV